MDAKVATVANGLGIARLRTQLFDELSSGEKTKIALAQLLLQKPEVLLLDEPTNHLDLSAIEWLEQYLKYFAGTVLVVSHDGQFMNQTVNKVMELEDGGIWVSHGNYDKYVEHKEQKLAQQFAQYDEQQKNQKNKRSDSSMANEVTPPNPDLFRKAKSIEKILARIELVKKRFSHYGNSQVFLGILHFKNGSF